MRVKKVWLSNILFIFGAVLVADAAFIHAIYFDYAKFGLAALDPYFSHAYIGFAFIAVALFGRG